MRHTAVLLPIAATLLAQAPAPPATEDQAAALRQLLARSVRAPRQGVPVMIQPPTPEWNTDYISSVASASDGTVYLVHRNLNYDPVVAIDPAGRIVRSWGKGMFENPHSVRLDPEGFLWTVDSRSSVVLKFTPEGKLLLRIEVGEQPPGRGGTRGTRGTSDIAFAAGRIFIADGYGNARVLEYDQQGRRVRQWGSAGTGPGQFNLPHGIAAVGDTLYVADRQNGRIQWFDLEGKHLGEWGHLGKTFSVTGAPDGNLWIGTHERNVINEAPGWLVNVERKTGRVLGYIESPGLHSVHVDGSGGVLADPGRGNLNRVVWFRER
jgi:DNA-binding beta-propeller fold protein YncE